MDQLNASMQQRRDAMKAGKEPPAHPALDATTAKEKEAAKLKEKIKEMKAKRSGGK